MAVRAVSAVRRTEIREGGTLGVLFEPAEGSDQFAVMLGGSFGGFPEAFKRGAPISSVSCGSPATRSCWRGTANIKPCA